MYESQPARVQHCEPRANPRQPQIACTVEDCPPPTAEYLDKLGKSRNDAWIAASRVADPDLRDLVERTISACAGPRTAYGSENVTGFTVWLRPDEPAALSGPAYREAYS